ncbi:MAG TPA: hypothetical protein VG406_13880, partial [Isosphaeraceae bacterium]|nr:hypothetical protein [Isosphaeraceae bacterium]
MSNAPIVVTSLADTLTPGTLRSAIQQANSQPGGNEIDLKASGTYALSMGSLSITPGGDDLLITNTSGGGVAIDGGKTDRVFDINSGAGSSGFSVEIDGVTIQNGNANSADPTLGSGGGIRVQGVVVLTLSNDTLLSNQAGANGGGLAVVNSPFSSVTVNSSQFLKNVAAGVGGGAETEPGQASIDGFTNVLFQNDSATSGGAIEDPGSSVLNLTRDTFDGNRALGSASAPNAGNGGAVDVTNPTAVTGPINVQILYSLFTNNSAFSGVSPVVAGTGNGGAINNAAGNLNLNYSQFVNDQAAGGGGGIFSPGLQLTVQGSTFTANQSGASLGVNSPNTVPESGGAIYAAGTGTNAAGDGSSVYNTTFTQNKATGNGGAVFDAGPGDLALVNDTIGAEPASNANTAGQYGGGLAMLGGANPGTLNVVDTILYNNTAATGGPDVATLNGSSVTDSVGNLVKTLSGSNGFAANTLTSDPLLGPLADYGGSMAGVNPPLNAAAYSQPILTEALTAKSPAINAGVASS